MRSARDRRRDRESGYTPIELVVWAPILFFLMFGMVEFGLAVYAKEVADSAAQEAALVARQEAANMPTATWHADVAQRAQRWVHDLMGNAAIATTPTPLGPLTRLNGTVVCQPLVGATVRVQVISALPGFSLTESATSQGPEEKFYPAQQIENCDG